MNRTMEVEHGTIEIVFMNCECINVELEAIESMYMITRGERYAFDKHSKNFLCSKEVKELELTLKVSSNHHFYHASPGQMLVIGGTESIFTDRQKCLERLLNCDDITHIYINGTCYQMPWKGGSENVNKYQTVTKKCTNGVDFITITIKDNGDSDYHV